MTNTEQAVALAEKHGCEQGRGDFVFNTQELTALLADHRQQVIEELDRLWFADRNSDEIADKAAAELRRLHALIAELVEALSDVTYTLEKARIWGGMEWKYNPLHPVHYLPARDKARAVLAKAGETT